MPGIYVDCSEAPYRMELFFPFLRNMRDYGIEYIFIDFGRYFPWSEKFRFNTEFTYPEEFISALDRESGGMGMKLIPVVSLEENGNFIADASSCTYLVPGFPDNLEINPEAAGASSFFEDILEDLAGLYYYSPGFLFQFPEKFAERVNSGITSAVSIADRLFSYASDIDKILVIKDIPRDGVVSWKFKERREYSSYHENLYRFSFRGEELPVKRFFSSIGFLPFGFLDYLAAGTDRERFIEEMNFIERYIEKENTVWDIYRTSSWYMSSLFLNNTGAFAVKLLNNYRLLSSHIEDYTVMSKKGTGIFSRYFENSFPDRFFHSRTEHILSLFRVMEMETGRIIRRIVR